MKQLKYSEKLAVRYVICVILPILAVNSIFLLFMRSQEEREQRNEMRAVIDQVLYELNRSIDEAVSVSDYLYMNSELNRFLLQEYADSAAYYREFNQLMQDNVIRYYYTAQSVYQVTVVTDNETITSGTYFVQEHEVEDLEWYRNALENHLKVMVCVNYNDNSYLRYFQRTKNISIIRKLNLDHGKAVLKLDVDYAHMVQNIFHEDQEMDIYICQGDNIILSNLPDKEADDFLTLADYQKKELEEADTVSLYGEDWKILVTSERREVLGGIRKNLPIFLIIILFDACFPMVVYFVTSRIHQEQQELELSKKQAELNALQSQMNPHFMFNTLESIRMHSLLKGEDETERMIGKFSLLLRQASQWDRDFIHMEEEMRFIQSYLEIQKYRFEERIDYEIYLEESCRKKSIPKFGILTFVENACVHGIEKKVQGGRIFVGVYSEEEKIRIEIGDDGIGMDQEQLDDIRNKIRQASIKDLKKTSHVGMLNAIVRLKVYYEGKVEFEIDSVPKEGTQITVLLDSQWMQKEYEKEEER